MKTFLYRFTHHNDQVSAMKTLGSAFAIMVISFYPWFGPFGGIGEAAILASLLVPYGYRKWTDAKYPDSVRGLLSSQGDSP